MLPYAEARVINDYVIVRPLAAEERTAGGLIRPEASQERPSVGIVIAVGPGTRHAITGDRVPLSLEVGDLVTFNKYAGIQLDEEQHVWLMRETELGVSFAPGQFDLVTHEDPKTWHLAESWCAECQQARGAANLAAFQEIRGTYGHLGVAMNVREVEDRP